MVKLATAILITLSLVNIANAGEINYDIKGDNISFAISYAKPYSAFDVLKSGNNYIFSFDTADTFAFEREDFFDLPITSAYIMDDSSYRKKFVVSFENEAIEPVVKRGDERLEILFKLPAGSINGTTTNDGTDLENNNTTPLPAMSSYIRMIFSLAIVLGIILIIYRFLRSYASKKVFTDIPGSGRLLGKVDLEMRRTLYFYELGDMLYILSGTDNSIQLVDKITDETEINKIKAGFIKKREFSGYMSFFSRTNAELDDDMSITNTVVADKVDNLRQKAGRKK